MKKIMFGLVLTVLTVLTCSCKFGAIVSQDNYISALFTKSPRQMKYQEAIFISRYFTRSNHNEEVKEVVRLIDYPTFMDETGFFTTFKYKPKRAAILFSSYAQVWQLAGGKVSITVQESLDRQFLEDSRVAIVGKGSGKDINLESLLAYEPDIVVLTADYTSHIELAEVLRLYEIPVLVLRVDSFFDYLKMLQIFTTILDQDVRYQQYGDAILDRIDSILEITEAIGDKPNVLFLRAYSYGAKVKTTNHFVGQMLKELGSNNIAEDFVLKSDTLSQESLMTADIDHIFISVMGDDEKKVLQYIEQELFQLPGYRSLRAVQEHQYTVLPKDLFSYKPNQNWDQAYEYLARILYPEYFSQ